MDIKVKSTSSKRQYTKARASVRSATGGRIPRNPGLNAMVYKTRFEFSSAVDSSTSGTIAVGSISPTIQRSSEYSILQSLFTECKLLKASVIFSAKAQSLSTITQGRVMIGTNMIFTSATYSDPSSINQVQNLTNPRTFSTNSVRPYVYPMPVPNLEFSNITADSPSTPTPWAGSPGCVVIWADGLTPSTAYLQIDLICTYWLRGRQ